MENKHFGYIMLGISAVMVFIVLLFNNALEKIVDAGCNAEHGVSCPMYTTINQQTYLALAIVGIIVIVGLVMIFAKPKETIIIKRIKERKTKKKFDLSDFRPDEKKIFKLIQDEGTAFQANLIEGTGYSKAKMTRILDKLEGNGLIERKRRGLTNVVVLKED